MAHTILNHLPCGIENFKIPFTRNPIRNRATAIACNIIHRVPDNLLTRKRDSPNKSNFKFRSATFDIWVWIVTKFQNSLSNISLFIFIDHICFIWYDSYHWLERKPNFVKYCRDILWTLSLWSLNPSISFEIITSLPSAHIQKLVSNELELLSDFTFSVDWRIRVSFARIKMVK